MTLLTNATLAAISLPVRIPTYDRSRLEVGIVHFGVGGFHRSHQAMYLDRLMEEGLAQDWAICGVGVLPQDVAMRNALGAQNGLYTLVLRHPDGSEEARVIGSLVDYLFAPDDPEAVIAKLADPAVRIVSLTVTEGGYAVDTTTGAFDATLPTIQHDLATPERPQSVFGLITAGLARRRAAGIAPFTVMSCDNIQGNGEIARLAITSFAKLLDAELAAWIDAEVAFPNGMVDRITPATTDADREAVRVGYGIDDAWPVVAEPFVQWVLEDHFPAGRPPYEQVGVQMVADVVPYEMMKLRLLNASHQAMAYPGLLAGYTFAHDVCKDGDYVRFLLDYMELEAAPTLWPVPGIDLADYQQELIARFASTAIRDPLQRLAFDGSERISKFLLPVVRDRLAMDVDIRRSALVIAAWALTLRGVNEAGDPLPIADQRAERLMAAAAAEETDPLALIGQQDVFGNLGQDERFVAVYLAARHAIQAHGALGAIVALNQSERYLQRPF